jgi:signal transduction histidine kinase/ActR/RegA family two-component response regulator
LLFRRPIILLMLAAFLPLAALSAALGIAALRAERNNIERDALQRVRLLSAALARDLTAQLDVLRVMAQSRDFDDGTTNEEFSELGRRIKQEMPTWLALRFSDPEAHVLADAQLVPGVMGTTPWNVVDIESHRQAVETKQPVIGKILLGPLGRRAFALRAPVIRDGVVKYVVSATLTPNTIRDRFLMPGLPKEWVATIIDGSGNIVARSSGSASLIGEPASAAAREAREMGKEGIYQGFLLEGAATISAYRVLPVGNWSVHVGVPRDVFMAPLQRSLWLIGAGLAFTLVLAVLFLWLLLREIKLRRREEASMESVRRLEALGRMTGGVAHDFNNLLMIVQGGAEGIKRRITDPDRQRTYADAILAAVQRGQSLTRQLLAFAQRGAHEPISFRMQDRTLELKELISRSVRENIDVKLLIPSDTWAVHADPNALEVALINLAVNASDAMPDGGTLSISAANFVLTKGREGNPGLEGSFVAIAVKDSGTGIAPEHIDRIFEPFFTTKSPGKGTGLGLSQVYGFAQQSGGSVTVRGKQGDGATFTIFLPRALTTPVPPPPRQLMMQAQPASDTGRVLLVEDNLSVAEVTAGTLSDAGYQVTRSTSASAARDLLSRNQDFEVILSDIVMDEGISGLDLARYVRATLPQLPIVLMTGFSEALKGADVVDVPVVFKPFTEQEILAALQQALRGRVTVTA